MADLQRPTSTERDVEQAIVALKKGAYLLKYGRRGKPKFCPFRLANDESTLIWYSGKDEKQLKLNHVSRIIPGQRTAIFQRYPRPEKEYQSFSLICTDRSLDLICKDKDEAEVWFVGLKALISRRKGRPESRSDGISTDGPSTKSQRNTPLVSSCGNGDVFRKESGEPRCIQPSHDNPPQSGFAKAFSDVILYTSATKFPTQSDTVPNSFHSFSYGATDNSNNRVSGVDAVRVSLSSAVSSSSHGSQEDLDALGDVFIWGEGVGDGLLGGGMHRIGNSYAAKVDALSPKALQSTVVLDVHNIACGVRHAVLVTKQGEMFSWGEESEGRLGHGVDADVSHPKLIETLTGINIELVACGEYHTCAVTFSGDLYTWGDGIHNSGLLGHGSEASHWIPKKISGQMEGFHVSLVACGPWHTAVITSAGQLFTFGDGTFGALGHGDRSSCSIPREVETLKGLRTIRVACGVWHTAAVVEVMVGSSSSGDSPCGKLFTWGDGDKGRLGHGDKEPRLVPACLSFLVDVSLCQVACGNDITVSLTTSGRVYTMGSTSFGQLGVPEADGKTPSCVEGKISDGFVEEIACGSYHVAVLTSKAEVYTWGKGANGQLGHGDNGDRNAPTLVAALKDKQVKSIVCGTNFTTVICLHKWASSADNSICSGCRNQFGFRRKRHNCYNCGLVFCRACSSKKSLKAALAPNFNKPYRVCDDCHTKLKQAMESGLTSRTKNRSGLVQYNPNYVVEKETLDPRIHGQLSRISSAESLKLAENTRHRRNRRLEFGNSRFALISSRSFEWGSFYANSSTLIGSSKKLFSTSVPGSKTASRATSPVPRKSSSPPSATLKPTILASPEFVADLKQENGSLSQEIIALRGQVENLTSKSKLLEDELERTSQQLKDATSKTGEETAKCKAAKEVIKSLTAQLKDMAGMVPSGSPSSSMSGSFAGDRSSNHIAASNVKQLSSPSFDENVSNPLSGSFAGGRSSNHIAASNVKQLNSPSSDENVSNPLSGSFAGGRSSNHIAASNVKQLNSPSFDENVSNPLSSNGTNLDTELAEKMVQDEPGVFITLSSLPGGGKNLGRIRFSRKRFSEKQAEEWWAANRVKLYERHDIRSAAKSFSRNHQVPPHEM